MMSDHVQRRELTRDLAGEMDPLASSPRSRGMDFGLSSAGSNDCWKVSAGPLARNDKHFNKLC
jgi:hypothetical protein